MQYLHEVPLASGGETSAEYVIPFPRQLPPREFVLQITLYYTIAGQLRSRMFYNETINVIEEPTLLDTQLLGLYIIGLALLGGAGEPARRPASQPAACWPGCLAAAAGQARKIGTGGNCAIVCSNPPVAAVQQPTHQCNAWPPRAPQRTCWLSMRGARAGSRSPSRPPGQVMSLPCCPAGGGMRQGCCAESLLAGFLVSIDIGLCGAPP